MRITHLFAAVATAMISTGAFAYTPPVVNFDNLPDGNVYESGTAYTKNFTSSYDGVVYGPSSTGAQNILDLDDTSKVPTFTVVGGNTVDSTNQLVTAYKVYVQDHVSIVANNTRKFDGTFISGDNTFTKLIDGDYATSTSAISGTGTYSYTGQLIVPVGTGTFNYTINRAALTGSGSASTTTTYGATTFTLGTANLSAASGKLSGTGSASVTTANTNPFTYNAGGLKYDVFVFGSAGQEVAGRIYGFKSDNPSNLTDLPFAGKR